MRDARTFLLYSAPCLLGFVFVACAASGGSIDDVGDSGAVVSSTAIDGAPRDAAVTPTDAGASGDTRPRSDADAVLAADAVVPRDADVSVSSGLLIARYTESSTFKAIAIWNAGTSAVDLSRYGLCLVSNANTYCNAKAMLSGSLAANAVRTVCYGSATSVPICDLNSNTVNVNGDDRIGLFLDANGDGIIELTDTPVDAFGELRVPPAGTPWADKTFARWNCAPRDGSGAFVVASWFDDVQPNPDTTGLRVTPSCR